MYQRLQVKATYQSRRLEAEILFLKTNLEKSNKKNEELEAEIISLKEDPEKSNKKNEDLLQNFEEQENGLKEEILKLNDQVEEGKRVEESMKQQCQRLEGEIKFLKGKLEEKDKLLRFQDSTKILDNILSSQRSPSVKFGIGFHETVKG